MNIDKRAKIIDAAMLEFAEKGFEQASTNTIAKVAGVSKGLIFHYFGNKEELFNYLMDHVLEIFTERHFDKIQFTSDDFIERLIQAYKYKLSVLSIHGPVTEFVRKFLFTSKYRDQVIARQQEMLTDIWDKMFRDVDQSEFKEGLKLEDMYLLSTFLFKGIGDAFIEAKGLTLEEFIQGAFDEEMEKWMKILRICFYK